MRDPVKEMEEHVASGNWPLAAGRMVEIIATAARGTSSSLELEEFKRGAEAMRSVVVEAVRAAYRKIEMNEPASITIGSLLEGLKRFDVGELAKAEKEQDAQQPSAN